MNRFNVLPRRFYHLTRARSGIFTFHDQAPLPRKPVADQNKNVTVAGHSIPVVEEKPGVVLYPIKKSPADAHKCEEIFSDNAKETPPLFFQYDGMQEPTVNAMYSDYNVDLIQRKEFCGIKGDDYSYHPFYMEKPFDKMTPAAIDQLTEMDTLNAAGLPAPKCPRNLKGVCEPIIVDEEKPASEPINPASLFLPCPDNNCSETVDKAQNEKTTKE